MAAFCLSLPAPAQAQDDGIYTVKGVSVDTTGASALDARNKAFTEARRKAYEQVADKLLTPEERPNLVMPDDRVLAGLVHDFEIVREKMTTRRYAGTLDIRFSPAAVKRTMQVAAVPQAQSAPQAVTTETTTVTTTETKVATVPATPAGTMPNPAPVEKTTITEVTTVTTPATPATAETRMAEAAASVTPKPATPATTPSAPKGPVLLLPWYGPLGQQTLWGQDNPWRDAWEGDTILAQDKDRPIVLPVGDVDDLREYSPSQPLVQTGNIGALLDRYKATHAVLAMAEKQPNGTMIISLFQYENGTAVPMGRFGVDNASGHVMDEAVKKTVASLHAMPVLTATAKSTVPVTKTTTVITASSPAMPVSSGPSMATPVSMMADAPQAETPTITTQKTVVTQKTVTPKSLVSARAGAYRTLARFSGLQQWVSMRQALGRVPGVNAINVRAISPSQASIDFAYSGDSEMLANAMAQNGLQITSAPAGAKDAPAYTLTMERSF